MCNLAQGIANEAKMEGKIEGKIAGVTETTENIVLKMYKNNYSFDQITLITEKTLEEIRIINQKHEDLKA